MPYHRKYTYEHATKIIARYHLARAALKEDREALLGNGDASISHIAEKYVKWEGEATTLVGRTLPEGAPAEERNDVQAAQRDCGTLMEIMGKQEPKGRMLLRQFWITGTTGYIREKDWPEVVERYLGIKCEEPIASEELLRIVTGRIDQDKHDILEPGDVEITISEGNTSATYNVWAWQGRHLAGSDVGFERVHDRW